MTIYSKTGGCQHKPGDPQCECGNVAPVEEEELTVKVEYETTEEGITVTAVLGESSIVIEHTWDTVEEAATLVNSLPQILISVQEALDQQEES